ncbi:hypothetical protein CERSUDRAFT_90458 [Gelatoporia subvermispora B]|uniref:serine--tRNA ligase n=1 Tax=Ceriporiopsis subvermispora (strain B) TaxID=914234 RepID=M2PYA3_CERS8|nr:hypothetical protein CERSUDRAFT_90458 [Gelatoporia subvermispora B]
MLQRHCATNGIRSASRCFSSSSSVPKTSKKTAAPDPFFSSSGIPRPRIDYRAISENVLYKSHNAFNRKVQLQVGAVQTVARLYDEYKQLLRIVQDKTAARNAIQNRIENCGGDKELRIAAVEEAKALKPELADLKAKLADVEGRLETLALAIPNDTHPLTPIGPESAAKVLSTHGPAPMPASPARDHVSICRALDLLDLESAAVVTGTSWYYLINEGALLELALINYALSIAMKRGFKPVTTPDVIRADIARRCGFQPRDQNADPPVSQMYHIANSEHEAAHHPELILAGTAEIPLAGMFAKKTLPVQALPVKLVGLGRAFRAEAGARGADTRGLYRVHQFTKLELFAVTAEEQSEEMMEKLRSLQVEIFEGLGLPFRVLDMPTEELGASAYRKYDIEAWMPGRGGWGEISSTSNCTDYQARRLHIRHERHNSDSDSATSKTLAAAVPFAHTLNGTAAAIPRLMVALVENGARFDKEGKVVGIDLPKSLRPFWVGGSARNIVQWI